MSDGPHNSLPMPPWWRRVAELADRETSDLSDLEAKIWNALAKEFQTEIPPSVITCAKRIAEAAEYDLFGELHIERLDEARKLSAGRPFALEFLDCLEHTLKQGKLGQEGIKSALTATVLHRAMTAKRQMHEHWIRQVRVSPGLRANALIQRFTHGLARIDLQRLSERLLSRNTGVLIRRQKKRGLDEGPKLPKLQN